MARGKKHTPEQVVSLLRQIEVGVANGKTTPAACREGGVTEQTYYRWRKEYGGLQVDQARRLKELEQENFKLKQLVEIALHFHQSPFLPLGAKQFSRALFATHNTDVKSNRQMQRALHRRSMYMERRPVCVGEMKTSLYGGSTNKSGMRDADN